MIRKRKVAVQIAAVVAGFVFATASAVAAPALVTNGNDEGPGSLRAALESGANEIVITGSVRTIETESTLEYTGREPLIIRGGKATIQPSGDFTVLAITEGADLTVSNLSIAGIGGFDVENQGVGQGKGIFVDVFGAEVPRSDTVKVVLRNVNVFDVAYHGVHISDCSGGDACGSGQSGDGNGTDASIRLVLKGVKVDGVGYGVFDADGVRVDERGDGDIVAKITRSKFLNVGADGVELDESGDGNVKVSMRNSSFNFNGGYCAPIDPNLPDPADPLCVEDDDGELVLDLDDGIDIDEGDGGSVWVKARNIKLLENLDEGFDFDEAGDGDIDLDLVRIRGDMNSDEAIKASEEDAGDIEADLRAIRVTDTQNNDGIELEETGDGDMFAALRAVRATGSGDGSGVEIVQLGGGELEVSVKGSVITDNSKDNLKVESFDDDDGDEVGTGTLKVRGSKIEDIVTNVDEI
jgi:hypothetical protein